MPEDLTENEQGAIHVAFALCGARGNLSPLLAVVDDIVLARQADAWDAAIRQQNAASQPVQFNPYRATEETL